MVLGSPLSWYAISCSGRQCHLLSSAKSRLPDVFAGPEIVEPGKHSIHGPVARVAVGERSAAELLSAQFKKDSFNGIAGSHILPMQLRAGEECQQLS